jgi:site-specific DNA-methyltransferase (adenine-specific)
VTPYYERNGITIYHGDALEVAGELPSTDLLLFDPPFFMPAQHYASRSDWSRSWGDTSVLRGWWSTVLVALTPRLRGTGNAFVFCDDESYPVFYPECYNRFPSLSALVWNKGRIGMGTPWRHAHEFIIHARRTDAKWCGGAGESDVLTFSPTTVADRWHPVSKPLALLRKLITLTTAPGDMVIDPFMGGGSTLDAAHSEGRPVVGVEIEERYCEIAARRLDQEVLAL